MIGDKFMDIKERESKFNFTQLTNEIITDGIKEFAVIDIETTGFGELSKIVEVSAVKFHNNKIDDIFETLVNPCMHIPSSATAIHGIRDIDVAEAPLFEEIEPIFCNFIGNLALVGHNVSFDLNFLIRCGCNLELKKRTIFDTLSIARKYVKDVPNHKLETMINTFNILTDKRHRAKDDSIATGELFMKLIEIAKMTKI
jgi:DNA polymerase-3 subunit epsilon